MLDQYSACSSHKSNFWSPLLSGTLTGLLLFTLALYFNFANFLIYIFFIPFSAGFVTLLRANSLTQSDNIARIFLPWAALVITLPLAYWKLKILIIVTFPIASLGGWLAGKLMTLLHQTRL